MKSRKEMKRSTVLAVVACFALAATVRQACAEDASESGISGSPAAPLKYRSYRQVSPRELKAMPEEFEGDRIYVEGEFDGFTVALPTYVERSGFRTGRYAALTIAGSTMPILVEKDDEMNALLLDLKKGVTLRVFGRVREFSHDPNKDRSAPRFYLDCVHVQVVSDSIPAKNKIKPQRGRGKAHTSRRRALFR